MPLRVLVLLMRRSAGYVCLLLFHDVEQGVLFYQTELTPYLLAVFVYDDVWYGVDLVFVGKCRVLVDINFQNGEFARHLFCYLFKDRSETPAWTAPRGVEVNEDIALGTREAVESLLVFDFDNRSRLGSSDARGVRCGGSRISVCLVETIMEATKRIDFFIFL